MGSLPSCKNHIRQCSLLLETPSLCRLSQSQLRSPWQTLRCSWGPQRGRWGPCTQGRSRWFDGGLAATHFTRNYIINYIIYCNIGCPVTKPYLMTNSKGLSCLRRKLLQLMVHIVLVSIESTCEKFFRMLNRMSRVVVGLWLQAGLSLNGVRNGYRNSTVHVVTRSTLSSKILFLTPWLLSSLLNHNNDYISAHSKS